ncbi:hypothetical protein CON48_12175 [Bacillus thuringiensis]|uniref:Peptidase S74 domain-containing protein n=1 Tax=Bacillus thuringiensis TaxID=1428 RepID=A0A9X6SHK5_BACTU|nr:MULTISPECIES: phage tail spike protein [Bacillus]MEC2946027.1 phage tail spike protein [Bacillus cereus]MEC3175753.1 phage tail spike protein [Bacillus cereus]PDY72543.1 hypothetical protein COM88_01955 [Bacillus cereus]PDY97582.1 hypothetical protein CON12_24065 [Bacillus thuringiensis]PEA50020.1 hypothetical protein CON48_12175 [Bacillus thuringiensis]
MKINKSLHVVDFKTNKIVAVFQPHDYWADVRTWELKDNVDYIEFKVFDGTKAAATLIQQNYVLRMTRDGKMIPYIIMDECEKDSSDRSITVRAVGAWVSLRGANFIRPQRIESQTAHQFLSLALAGTKFEIGKIDYKSFHTMTIDTFIDPLDFLKRIKNLFQSELQYRVEVVASKITGWYVDLIEKRGTYTGKEIRLGKDLNNIIRKEHTQNICTALLGYSKTGEGNLVTVESINNGSPYIVDNEAFQRWSQNGQHIFAIYQPETEEEITPERLMTLMKTEIKKHTDASVQYEVDAADIASIFGLNHEMIGEGDTLRIIDKGFTPALYLEARAIGGKESHTNPETNKYKFGNFVELQNTNDELQKLYNKVLSLLNDKASKPLLDELEKKLEKQKKELETVKEESGAAMDIAEKVKNILDEGLVEIFEGPVAPTKNLIDRKTLWLDTSEELPGVLKMWKDGKWEPVVPDVTGIKKEVLEEVAKEISEVQSNLNKEVESLKEEASKIKGEIADVSKEIENKVDQEWINNELKDKADKSGVYTKEEIKAGFIGKQVYETDKQGNIQKFKEVNTSINQTNEALTQKAEKSELSKTNEGLNQLEKKANEIETTAEGTKQTVSEIKSNVSGLTGSVNNLTKKTTEIETTVNGINSSVSNVQDSQGKLEKRMTTQEQTADGFKQSINKLQTDASKTSEQINKIEQDASGTKQTISKIQTDVKGINGSVDNLTKTTTEIKTEAGKTNQKLTEVTSKVDNIKVGNRNLLKDSKKAFNTTDYLINQYTLSEDWVTGQEYTFIIKGSVPAGQKFGVWQNGGSNNVGYATNAYINGVTYVTFKAVAATAGNEKKLSLYNYPNNTTKAVVEWVALYVGNKPLDWTAAPEENVSTTDFTKKTTEIETSVKGIKETITKVENDQTNFDKRVTAVEKNAEGITQNVSKIQQAQTAQGKQISEAQTTIKQHSEQISLTLKKKDMEDYVGGLGSINELRNAGFVSGLYWGLAVGTTIQPSSKFKTYITAWSEYTGKTTDHWSGGMSEFVDCVEGEDFVGSAWFATDNIASIDSGIWLELEFFNTSKTRVRTNRVKVEWSKQGEWIRVALQEKTRANEVFIRWRWYVQRNGRVRVAMPMLQRGKVATEFWLHPKDVTDYDKLADDIAHRVATEDFNKKVTELSRDIKANADGILLKATKNEVYTKTQADGTFAGKALVNQMEARIGVNEKNISISVKENNIISKINVSKETILLEAKRINLKGYITADHFQAGTIKGVRYESVNPSNATNKVVIENSLIKSYGPMDKVLKKQNYAEMKEGGLYIYEMAESGSPFGDKEAYILPARLNARQGDRSSALEPTELRMFVGGMYARASLDVLPRSDRYGWRLEADGGVLVKNTYGGAALQIGEDNQSIHFDSYGNISGGPHSNGNATWSIRDGDGRIKFLTGVGKGSSQTTEISAYVGGISFNQNGNRIFSIWRQGDANYITQFGPGQGILKWQVNAGRFEFRNANDSNWVNAAAGSFQNASSLVWKKDIQNFEESALDLIMNTNVMTYRYKNTRPKEPFVDADGKEVEVKTDIEEDGRIHVGVISEFAPEIITNEDGSAVDLYAMISVSWKGIQENNKTIQEKDKEIKVLNDRIYKVESQLQAVLELLGKD